MFCYIIWLWTVGALLLWRMLPSALRVAQFGGQMLPMNVMRTTVSSNILVRLVGTGQVKTSDVVSFRSFIVQRSMLEVHTKLCSFA